MSGDQLCPQSSPRNRVGSPFFLLLLYLSTNDVLTFKVSGYTGGAVAIKCGYEKKHQQNKKYFCKGTPCQDLIKTNLKGQWVNAGRFSLYDNTAAGFFMVIFRGLSPKDTGKYYCGVDIEFQRDTYTEVDLNIREDHCCVKSLELSAYEGQTVNISCKFPQEYKNRFKYFCKDSGGLGCKNSPSTQEKQSWVSNGRSSLHDNREGVLTVSINSFSTSDAGSYWCGLDMGQYQAWITHVQITLNKRITPSASRTPTTTGSGVAVTMSGTVLLFLTTSTIVIIIIWKCRSNAQRSESAGITTMGESTTGIQVLSSEPYYEEIRHSVDRNTALSEDNTLHTETELPTTPSDNDALYNLAQLPKTTTVDDTPYTMAQLPTTPSNCPPDASI